MKNIYFYFIFIMLSISIQFSQVSNYSSLPNIEGHKVHKIKFNNLKSQQLNALTKIIQDTEGQYIFQLKTNSNNPDLNIYILNENNSFSGPYYFDSMYLTTNPFTCQECIILIHNEIEEELEIELLNILIETCKKSAELADFF